MNATAESQYKDW